MNTCGTCKWLGREVENRDRREGWCVAQAGTGFYPCTRITDGADNACSQDYSGYYSALCVKEDFGCNLWEAK